MKNLIFCFDGTCNEPADAEQESTFFGLGELEDSSITNVLKLHLMLGGDLRGNNAFEGQKQYSFYYSGVGTYGSAIQKAFNAALAPQNLDVDHIIANGFEDLTKMYDPGDQIFLFGFSRGAALARQFAAKMRKNLHTIEPGDKPVRFMGVFDTVAVIGDANLDSNEKPVSDVLFEDNFVADTVQEALHLVALDEKRIAFQPTLMNQEDRVTEVWFPGAHSDIGGGYRRDGLSDGTLHFMLEKIRDRELGLRIRHPHEIVYENLLPPSADFKIDYTDVMISANPLGVSHQQKRPPITSKITLNHRLLRVNQDDKPCDELPLLHHFVAQRIHGDSDYKPQSLVHVKHRMLMPNGKVKEFDGGKTHRALGRMPLGDLKPGEQEIVRVFANQKYNHSGVLLREGEKYYFTEKVNGQQWYDSTIPATIKGWDLEMVDLGFLKELFINFAEDDRRVPEAKWFELVAAVGKSDQDLFRICNHLVKTKPYTPPRNGEFCPFANDIESRYGNNMGFVDIVIHRL